MIVDNSPVIGRRFGKGLAGQGEAGGRGVQVSEHAFHPRDGLSFTGVDGPNSGRGMRAAQDLDDEGIFTDIQIAGVGGSTLDEAEAVNFGDFFADKIHYATPIYFLMARIWPL